MFSNNGNFFTNSKILIPMESVKKETINIKKTQCPILSADAEYVYIFKAKSTDLVKYHWGGYSNTTKNDKL